MLDSSGADEVAKLKESESKLQQQVEEFTRRENVLKMRLATKQQELQELIVSVWSRNIAELTCGVSPSLPPPIHATPPPAHLCDVIRPFHSFTIFPSSWWPSPRVSALDPAVNSVEQKSQVHELKQAQTAEGSQLHRMLIDPAVNLVFERMKRQLSDYKEKLEQAQSDLSAWKFTPDRLAGSI